MQYTWIILNLLMCFVLMTRGCYLGEKEEPNQIHVIHLAAPNDEELDSIPDIIEVELPDDREKREVPYETTIISCKTDSECSGGLLCDNSSSICFGPSNDDSSKNQNGGGDTKILRL